MNLNRFNILYLMEMIAREKGASQRHFSETLDVSLGLVNRFIKRLVQKGYCTVRSMPRNRIKYILTPAGEMEKTRLMYEHFISSCQYYETAKNRLRSFFSGLEGEGVRRIVFYGAGELSDIALQSMKGSQLELVSIVDPSMKGERSGHGVEKTATRLSTMAFDALVVTTVGDHGTALQKIKAAGVPDGKIRFIG